MENRIALIGIILESRDSVDELNHLLSQYGEYVIGRMGIPYREKGIHVISVDQRAFGETGDAPRGEHEDDLREEYMSAGRLDAAVNADKSTGRITEIIDQLEDRRSLTREEWTEPPVRNGQN